MSRQATGQVLERAGKRGTTFAVRYRANGRRYYETLGTVKEGWDRQRAERKLRVRLDEIEEGTWKPPAAAPVIEEPKEEPTFHVFASEYVAAREHEVSERTAEFWRWSLSSHLLPFFKDFKLRAIDAQAIDRYKLAKTLERQRADEARAIAKKGETVKERGLSPYSINRTIELLAAILDRAREYGLIDSNPARGRRLKVSKPRRTWLEADELRDLLEAAGDNKAVLAVMALAGLRVGEATALRWRHVDLARGTLTVESSKTDAGRRTVELTPDLRETLTLHRAKSEATAPDDVVFTTSSGKARDRSNVRRRVLLPAIKKANQKRAKAGSQLIGDVSNHSLRRTFASLLYEAGASPAFVMAEMGHTSAQLALEVYARKMDRARDTGAKIDALVRGAEWHPDRAQTGTNESSDAESLSVEDTVDAASSLSERV